MSRLSRGPRALAAALAAGPLLACGGAEAPPQAVPGPVPQAPPAAEAPAPLEPGQVVVDLDGGRLSLRANEAPRSAVLAALAEESGFTLEAGPSGAPDRRISARIEGASLFEVLSLVLRETDFSLDLAFDRGEQRHRIAALRMGPPGGNADGSHDPLVEAFYGMLDDPDPQVVLAALEALERVGDADAVPEIEPLLDDADPEVRDAAAAALDEIEGL